MLGHAGYEDCAPCLDRRLLARERYNPRPGENVKDFRRGMAVQAEPVAGASSATPQVIPSVGVPPLEKSVRQLMRPLTASSQPSCGVSASSRTIG